MMPRGRNGARGMRGESSSPPAIHGGCRPGNAALAAGQGSRIKMICQRGGIGVCREAPAAGSTPNIERLTPNAKTLEHSETRHRMADRLAFEVKRSMLGVRC